MKISCLITRNRDGNEEVQFLKWNFLQEFQFSDAWSQTNMIGMIRSAITYAEWGAGTFQRDIEIAFAVVTSKSDRVHLVIPVPCGTINQIQKYLKSEFPAWGPVVKAVYLDYHRALKDQAERQNRSAIETDHYLQGANFEVPVDKYGLTKSYYHHILTGE